MLDWKYCHFTLNIETRKWVTDLKPEGRQPEPRSFHSCVAVGSRIVVSGGRGTSDQHFQDFHVFDTSKYVCFGRGNGLERPADSITRRGIPSAEVFKLLQLAMKSPKTATKRYSDQLQHVIRKYWENHLNKHLTVLAFLVWTFTKFLCDIIQILTGWRVFETFTT